LEAIGALAVETATAFWLALGIKSVGDLRPLRPVANPAFDRLSVVLDLERQGLLYREAVIQLQIEAVRESWRW
jgi:hypothetical protein